MTVSQHGGRPSVLRREEREEKEWRWWGCSDAEMELTMQALGWSTALGFGGGVPPHWPASGCSCPWTCQLHPHITFFLSPPLPHFTAAVFSSCSSSAQKRITKGVVGGRQKSERVRQRVGWCRAFISGSFHFAWHSPERRRQSQTSIWFLFFFFMSEGEELWGGWQDKGERVERVEGWKGWGQSVVRLGTWQAKMTWQCFRYYFVHIYCSLAL